jgi:hypothetical protein
MDNRYYLHLIGKTKYIASIIASDLRGNTEIRTRIAKAHCSNACLSTKNLLNMAIPLNMVLWGCKIWALKEREK